MGYLDRILIKTQQVRKVYKAQKLLKTSRGDHCIGAELLKLIDLGWVNLEGAYGSEKALNMCRRYDISPGNFKADEGNYSWPIMNRELHGFLESDELLGILTGYFKGVYGKMPVLQTIPSVVVTKPSLEQQDFIHGKHRFPAVWHTDYPTEFTVHIPLCEINASTPHTKYIETSHRHLSGGHARAQPDADTSPDYKDKKVAECFAEPGDAILLDVTGLHRAQLTCMYRALIQLKYTCGNDTLIFDSQNEKFRGIVKVVREGFCQNDRLAERIAQDAAYIKHSKFDPIYRVIKESISTFESYI
jgi:hypothetical protein